MLKKASPALDSPIARSPNWLSHLGSQESQHLNLRAIQHLSSVQVAFTRPLYGKYNNIVHQAVANKNQKLVNWSFNSGDSIEAMPAESNAAYDKLIKDHPSSALALNHRVYSTFLFFSFNTRLTGSYMLSMDTTTFIVAPDAIKVLQSASYNWSLSWNALACNPTWALDLLPPYVSHRPLFVTIP